jgi:gamma-glutamyltranspeptidase/glutathione hydrolase
MSESQHFPFRISGTHYPSRRSTVVSQRGMVATSQPLAALVGIDILKRGGNAIDAAVATAAMLNVVEPMSTGIGGDAFALIFLAGSGEVKALNGSGRAPLTATVDEYHRRGHNDKIPLFDILAVSVPGTVDAWATALETHGTMSLAEVLAPAIDYAENGFPVSEVIAAGWHAIAPRLMNNTAARTTYLVDGLRAPYPGEIFRQPNLAETFRQIAAGGRDAFYKGPIAEAIVRASEQLDGLLTLADFANHTTTWDTPISINYRGYQVWECPPNGQGLAALLALNILQNDDLPTMGPDSADALHLQIEAMRLAFADAFTYIADPSQVHVPINELLSPSYAEQRRMLLDPRYASRNVSAGMPANIGEDTVYLTVVDEQGNACSFINSLFHGFGSGIVAGDTGIALQNRAACFVLDDEHRNVIAPGKRPYHTIIPCMVTQGDWLYASMGVMGGFMQPQGHLQTLINLIDFGLTPQEALDKPRFEVQTDLNTVALEASLPLALRDEMERRGHDIVAPQTSLFGFGGGQIIVIDEASGARVAGSDPRKDGCAIGY